jgi:hypothetical protein
MKTTHQFATVPVTYICGTGSFFRVVHQGTTVTTDTGSDLDGLKAALRAKLIPTTYYDMNTGEWQMDYFADLIRQYNNER